MQSHIDPPKKSPEIEPIPVVPVQPANPEIVPNIEKENPVIVPPEQPVIPPEIQPDQI